MGNGKIANNKKPGSSKSLLLNRVIAKQTVIVNSSYRGSISVRNSQSTWNDRGSPNPVSMDKMDQEVIPDSDDESTSTTSTVRPTYTFNGSLPTTNGHGADDITDLGNGRLFSPDHLNGGHGLPSFQSAFGGQAKLGGWYPKDQYGQDQATGSPMEYYTNFHNSSPNYPGYQHEWTNLCIPRNPTNLYPPLPRDLQNLSASILSDDSDNSASSSDKTKCVGQEMYDFLKTCILELDRTMTAGQASLKLTSAVLPLEQIFKVISEQEGVFRLDVLQNDHSNHGQNLCDAVKQNCKPNKKELTEQSATECPTTPTQQEESTETIRVSSPSSPKA